MNKQKKESKIKEQANRTNKRKRARVKERKSQKLKESV